MFPNYTTNQQLNVRMLNVTTDKRKLLVTNCQKSATICGKQQLEQNDSLFCSEKMLQMLPVVFTAKGFTGLIQKCIYVFKNKQPVSEYKYGLIL